MSDEELIAIDWLEKRKEYGEVAVALSIISRLTQERDAANSKVIECCMWRRRRYGGPGWWQCATCMEVYEE